MIKIVGKFMVELKDQIRDKGIKIKLKDDAIDLLIKKGFDSKMGARPLGRKINDLIKVPLSKKILFERIPVNSAITVDWTGTEFTFDSRIGIEAPPTVDEHGYIVLEK
jgi:ATP-dependent Clp protease ATP-binding subunit ClpA